MLEVMIAFKQMFHLQVAWIILGLDNGVVFLSLSESEKVLYKTGNSEGNLYQCVM